MFVIDGIQPTNPITYKLKDLKEEPIGGSFYEQELQKFSARKSSGMLSSKVRLVTMEKGRPIVHGLEPESNVIRPVCEGEKASPSFIFHRKCLPIGRKK